MNRMNRVSWYILSFLLPFIGLIMGLIWLSSGKAELRGVGKNCLLAVMYSLIAFVCLGIINYVSISKSS